MSQGRGEMNEDEKAVVEKMLGALLSVLDEELTGLVKDLARMRDSVRVVRTLAGFTEGRHESAGEGDDVDEDVELDEIRE